MIIENLAITDGSITIRNIQFLNSDESMVAINIQNVNAICGKVAVRDYLHKNSDFYRWAKRKVGDI